MVFRESELPVGSVFVPAAACPVSAACSILSVLPALLPHPASIPIVTPKHKNTAIVFLIDLLLLHIIFICIIPDSGLFKLQNTVNQSPGIRMFWFLNHIVRLPLFHNFSLIHDQHTVTELLHQ